MIEFGNSVVKTIVKNKTKEGYEIDFEKGLVGYNPINEFVWDERVVCYIDNNNWFWLVPASMHEQPIPVFNIDLHCKHG